MTDIGHSRPVGHWRAAVLAATASYFDAGSIVAGAGALSLWDSKFHLGSTLIGLIAAFSANGFSTGVGALVGGWLGDRFGRRVIYTWDLLLYALGALVVAFAPSAAILILGYILVGLAVGADIPNSLALLAEIAPKNGRSRTVGLSPLMWYIGPLVVTILTIFLRPLGLTGSRIIFAHLALVAVVVWFLRRRMVESPRWEQARKAETAAGRQNAARPRNSWRAMKRALPAFLFIGPLVMLWNIPAGTYGFFFPFLLATAGTHSALAADVLNMLLYAIGLVTLAVYLFIGDRIDRRKSYVIFSVVAALAFLLFTVIPVTDTGAVVANILLMGIGGYSATFHVWSVWSTELFDTNTRATAQGWVTALMRFAVGGWSLILPIITADAGFTTVALLLGVIYLIGAVMAGLFGPTTQGRELDTINFSWTANFRRKADERKKIAA